MERASFSGRLAQSTGLCSEKYSARTLLQSKALHRVQRRQQVCRASMGIGFTQDSSTGLVLPKHANPMKEYEPEYGLTVGQMKVLGLSSNDTMNKLPEVEAVGRFDYLFYVIIISIVIISTPTDLCLSLFILCSLHLQPSPFTLETLLMRPSGKRLAWRWIPRLLAKHPLICLHFYLMAVFATLACL
jgi:hypothetical protein